MSSKKDSRDWDCPNPKCDEKDIFGSKDKCRKCHFMNPALLAPNQSPNGDWACSCGEINFQSKGDKCRKCSKENPYGKNKSYMLKSNDDWHCKCGFINFKKNEQCKKCDEEKPERKEYKKSVHKDDIVCDNCNYRNFSNRSMSLRRAELSSQPILTNMCKRCGEAITSEPGLPIKKGKKEFDTD